MTTSAGRWGGVGAALLTTILWQPATVAAHPGHGVEAAGAATGLLHLLLSPAHLVPLAAVVVAAWALTAAVTRSARRIREEAASR